MTTATLVLANRNYSSWSFRGWLAVRQAGLDVEEVVIPLDEPETAARIRRYSPSGLVPALVEGERVVWDSLAILEDLDDRFPQAGLLPAESLARSHARSIVAEMHAGFRALRTNMPMNMRAAKPGRGRAEGVAADIARITGIWGDCHRRYGVDGPYLFGRWSGADAAFAPVVSRFATYAVDLDPVARAYTEAVRAHPWYREWAAAAAAEPWAIAKYDSI